MSNWGKITSKLKEKLFPTAKCARCGQAGREMVFELERAGQKEVICAACFHALLHQDHEPEK